MAKQQYCDSSLITFSLQGLLWVSKEDVVGYYGTKKEKERYALNIQYRTQSKQIYFDDREVRDATYEKARLLLVPAKTE